MNGWRKRQWQFINIVRRRECKCCLTLHMTDNKLYIVKQNKTEQKLLGFHFALSLSLFYETDEWNPQLDGDEQYKVNYYYQTKSNPITINHSEQNNAEQFEPLEWLECVEGMQFTCWIDIQCSLLNDAQYSLDFNQMSNKIVKSKCELKVNWNSVFLFVSFH